MARVFRHSYTKKLPDGNSEKHVCPKWYVDFTDASGRLRRMPGFTDKRATEAYANELQRKVDREKAGIIDNESVELSQELTAKIDRHIGAYKTHLQATGVSAAHLYETERRLRRIVDDCEFDRLSEIRAEPVQRWCTQQLTGQRSDDGRPKGMGPRTINTYMSSLRAFVRWCIADRRMASDPLVTLSTLDESADVRRVRRALTEYELSRLLDVAEHRPLLDAMTIRRGPRKGQVVGKLKDATRTRLEQLGRERRLIYMTLVLTGLRRGELAALTWADLQLDDVPAWVTVPASVAKNRKAESVPIRADLAHELQAWRAESWQASDAERVFTVPRELVKILRRDLNAAEIDPAGVDVHSLRHTTATYLAKAGVAPRTAQSIMRHSDIRLTLGTYTDPALLDTAGALTALPTMTGSDGSDRMRATGTLGKAGDSLGVPLGGKTRTVTQSAAKTCAGGGHAKAMASDSQPVAAARLSSGSQRDSTKRASGFEPPTSSLGRRHGASANPAKASTKFLAQRTLRDQSPSASGLTPGCFRTHSDANLTQIPFIVLRHRSVVRSLSRKAKKARPRGAGKDCTGRNVHSV